MEEVAAAGADDAGGAPKLKLKAGAADAGAAVGAEGASNLGRVKPVNAAADGAVAEGAGGKPANEKP